MILNVLIILALLLGAGLVLRELLPTRSTSCLLCKLEIPNGMSFCTGPPDHCFELYMAGLTQDARVDATRVRQLTLDARRF